MFLIINRNVVVKGITRRGTDIQTIEATNLRQWGNIRVQLDKGASLMWIGPDPCQVALSLSNYRYIFKIDSSVLP